MSAGLDHLKHIVVLMMENRSFDHMLGALKADDPRINGLTGSESNLDTTDEPVKVQPLAKAQGQLDPDPDHHFPAVHTQLGFSGPGATGTPTMSGFVRSYYDQQRSVSHSRKIMYYFKKENLPVLTTLAREFAVFNGWFSSIPGPTLCNRAFAHYGTSFGQVSMDLFYLTQPYASVYERMLAAGLTAKIYYYDTASSTMEVVNLLRKQPQIFGTFDQFLADCAKGALPQYSFVEPNYSDHEDAGGAVLACDQHPDHDIQAGEEFIARVYNAIHGNPELWKNTALLIVYDEHGGIYDHVAPPNCVPDGYIAKPEDTGIGIPFAFDRLGIRVPAILVSPWIAEATVVPGTEAGAAARVFDHASIPATVTEHFIGNYDARTIREKQAATYLDLLGDTMRPDRDVPNFQLD